MIKSFSWKQETKSSTFFFLPTRKSCFWLQNTCVTAKWLPFTGSKVRVQSSLCSASIPDSVWLGVLDWRLATSQCMEPVQRRPGRDRKWRFFSLWIAIWTILPICDSCISSTKWWPWWRNIYLTNWSFHRLATMRAPQSTGKTGMTAQMHVAINPHSQATTGFL